MDEIMKEKMSSRKYRIVLFWNTLSVVTLILQSLIVLMNHEIKLPLDILFTITGILNAEYLGVNILEKKILNIPEVKK